MHFICLYLKWTHMCTVCSCNLSRLVHNVVIFLDCFFFFFFYDLCGFFLYLAATKSCVCFCNHTIIVSSSQEYWCSLSFFTYMFDSQDTGTRGSLIETLDQLRPRCSLLSRFSLLSIQGGLDVFITSLHWAVYCAEVLFSVKASYWTSLTLAS